MSPSQIPHAASKVATALLIIDVQQGFFSAEEDNYFGPLNNPSCIPNIVSLLRAARSLPSPPLIIHVQHLSRPLASPLHPSKPTHDFVDGISPEQKANGIHITKDVNSAFIGTNLEATLRKWEIKQLVICGLTTDHCVSTTTRMAKNLRVLDDKEEEGRIILVGNACATFAKGSFDADVVHNVHLASLKEEFAEIWETNDVLEKVLK
ncbi:Isochorismatase hydrolase [Atractiella rhizophila]|nr:Isochorismatase hydrolase [Atractiella rhizophila]